MVNSKFNWLVDIGARGYVGVEESNDLIPPVLLLGAKPLSEHLVSRVHVIGLESGASILGIGGRESEIL